MELAALLVPDATLAHCRRKSRMELAALLVVPDATLAHCSLRKPNPFSQME